MSYVDESAAVTASSLGVALTSPASTHTKPTGFTTLIASTSEETYWVTVSIWSNNMADSTVDESFLIDLAVGAVSSETVFISNIPYFGNIEYGGISFSFPYTIASGSRVSARCQSTASTETLRIMVRLSNDDSYGTSTSNETIGANTGASVGTDIDPGSSANTKPTSYTTLTALSGIEYNCFLVFQALSDNDNINSAGAGLFDIATGAVSSEVDLIANEQYLASSLEVASNVTPYWATIPSGTRISARAQSTITDSNDRLIDLVIIGFAVTAPSGGGGSGGGRLVNGGLIAA